MLEEPSAVPLGAPPLQLCSPGVGFGSGASHVCDFVAWDAHGIHAHGKHMEFGLREGMEGTDRNAGMCRGVEEGSCCLVVNIVCQAKAQHC